MEMICEHCQKSFRYSGKGRQPKYCPQCRNEIYDAGRLLRRKQRQTAERRHSVLHPGPARALGLNDILQELEQFNVLRRANGRSAVSYGQYVAMRDRSLLLSR